MRQSKIKIDVSCFIYVSYLIMRDTHKYRAWFYLECYQENQQDKENNMIMKNKFIGIYFNENYKYIPVNCYYFLVESFRNIGVPAQLN